MGPILKEYWAVRPSSSGCMPVSPLVYEPLEGPALFIYVCGVESRAPAGSSVEGTMWNLQGTGHCLKSMDILFVYIFPAHFTLWFDWGDLGENKTEKAEKRKFGSKCSCCFML